MIKAFAGVS